MPLPKRLHCPTRSPTPTPRYLLHQTNLGPPRNPLTKGPNPMPITILTIDPIFCEVKTFDLASDRSIITFARELAGGELDHGTIAIYPSGHRLCIWVYEYGLLSGPKTTKQYFILNNQLYNGRAVLYTTDPNGETVSSSKALAEHLNSGDCPRIIWLEDADHAE